MKPSKSSERARVPLSKSAEKEAFEKKSLDPRYSLTTNTLGIRRICRRGSNGFEVGVPDEWMKKTKATAKMTVVFYSDVRDPKLLMAYLQTEEV